MPKIEDELRSEFLKKFWDDKHSCFYYLVDAGDIADFFISRLSQYHKAKLEEVAKSVEGMDYLEGTKGKAVFLNEVLKIIREGK
jgi:hypothetical protein